MQQLVTPKAKNSSRPLGSSEPSRKSKYQRKGGRSKGDIWMLEAKILLYVYFLLILLFIWIMDNKQ